MEIKLNLLRIQNFKGIRSFTLNIDGKNATIYGDNGTGKTTQMDAFLWLLFNKDSTDRTSFKVKPQDKLGEDIHNLQTEVEAELTINGIPLLLRKMQEEKWTKRRGSAEAELTGNTISYWVDDVPVKEGEYKSKIGSLVDENIFRMITNPMYFNSVEKWQRRREIILEMCGDVSDIEVIDSDKALIRLKQLLNNHSVEDYEKIVKEKIKRLKKERADIPPRIDELTLTLPQQEIDYSDVEKQIKEYGLALDDVEKRLSDISVISATFANKQQEFYRLEREANAIKEDLKAEANANRNKMVKDSIELESKLLKCTADASFLQRKIENDTRQIQSNLIRRKSFIDEWKALKAEKDSYLQEVFVVPEDDISNCPTCGQELPEGDKEAKLLQLREKFEANKKRNIENVDAKLNKNVKDGLELKQDTEALEKAVKDNEVKLMELKADIERSEKNVHQLKIALEAPEKGIDFTGHPALKDVTDRISALKIELEEPIQDSSDYLLEKRDIQNKINECNAILHNKKKIEETKGRIDELMEEEKRISAFITDFEGQEYLLEQFVVSKVNYLEDKINSHFRHVKFKMFEQQINGGIVPACIAMVNTNGVYVPFTDANHAGKVNAGLDCINALGAFYEVTAPIFIDFRESVSRIIDTNSQVINLFKSEVDKVLRVEVEE